MCHVATTNIEHHPHACRQRAFLLSFSTDNNTSHSRTHSTTDHTIDSNRFYFSHRRSSCIFVFLCVIIVARFSLLIYLFNTYNFLWCHTLTWFVLCVCSSVHCIRGDIVICFRPLCVSLSLYVNVYKHFVYEHMEYT